MQSLLQTVAFILDIISEIPAQTGGASKHFGGIEKGEEEEAGTGRRSLTRTQTHSPTPPTAPHDTDAFRLLITSLSNSCEHSN